MDSAHLPSLWPHTGKDVSGYPEPPAESSEVFRIYGCGRLRNYLYVTSSSYVPACIAVARTKTTDVFCPDVPSGAPISILPGSQQTTTRNSMSHLTLACFRRLHDESVNEMQRLDQQKFTRPEALYKRVEKASLNPVIPDPGLFESLKSSTNKPSAALPTVAECAVHLELLEVFYRLRSRIVNSTALDRTFGVYIDEELCRAENGSVFFARRRDDTWPARRAKKWTYFLSIAAGRFLCWAREADTAMASESKVPHNSSRPGDIPYLPPIGKQILCPARPNRARALTRIIDILMVWHAFLLNPSDFARYCDEADLRHINQASFPCSQIVSGPKQLPSSETRDHDPSSRAQNS